MKRITIGVLFGGLIVAAILGGFAVGKDVGHQDGFDAGYQYGIDAVLEEFEEEYGGEEGIERMYDERYEEGYEEGLWRGYLYGYKMSGDVCLYVYETDVCTWINGKCLTDSERFPDIEGYIYHYWNDEPEAMKLWEKYKEYDQASWVCDDVAYIGGE